MRFDPTIAVQLFLIFPLCTGLLFPVQRASGFDSLIDYALNLVNSKIRNLNDTAVWVPTADLGLPAEVKRVQVYDLSTIHRLGEASLIHSEGYPEQINVTVEVGLSNLIVYLDLKESILHGGANLNITDNSVMVDLSVEYWNDRCELVLNTADVKLRGTVVNVWGLTIIGNKVAKAKIVSALSEKIPTLEKQASDYIIKNFSSMSDVITMCKIVNP